MIFLFLQEREKQAAKRSFYLFSVLLVYLILCKLFFHPILIYIDLTAILIFGLMFLFPNNFKKGLTEDYPINKYDERDIMFSRKELIPGSENYINYYKLYPEREIKDNLFRKEAGLLSKEAKFYHAHAFQAAKTFFQKIKELHPDIEGVHEEKKVAISTSEFTKQLKKKTKALGALDVGITLAKNYHFYSHKGRGESYGKEIHNSHPFALAFTVEMDQDMVAAAPKASIVMESARQYLNAGTIAVEIAKYIRSLGYEARAHIDGNYEVICPLVARDAGLGEIGRMGLLMTPKEGPRVRIGVVTTNIELEVASYKKDYAVIDFCMRCKKCAECCPSKSISFSDPKEVDGIKRWKIDSESCFTYWCKAGTDCGRCMAVCPYSHPNNSMHNLIRWGIKHSRLFRIIAVYLDDFFYGAKPKPKALPEEKILKLNL